MKSFLYGAKVAKSVYVNKRTSANFALLIGFLG